MANVHGNVCVGIVPAPAVRIQIDSPRLVYKHVSQQALKRTSHEVKTRYANSTPQGVTNTKQSVYVNTQLQNSKYGGVLCGSPVVTVRIINRIIEVSLPEFYDKSSCEYKEVYHHENKHVRVFVEETDRIMREEYQKLQKEIASHYGAFTSTQEINRYLDEMNQSIEARITARFGEIDRSQEQVDSEEEYNRVKTSCRNWKIN